MKIEGFQFKKSERIVSQKQIDELFTGVGSHTRAAFPLRVVYIIKVREDDRPPAQLLISVPKRRFRHAVDRNRVKRQLREAYRTNKHLLLPAIPSDQTVSIAFIWLSDIHLPTKEIVNRVKYLLTHIAEKLKTKD
ncbi:MAG: ribonuclease P protein component [Prevotella sp.]|nr:ribonuclease P protein component [Prevotella sp.]